MEEHQMIQGLESAARLLRAGKTLDKEHKDALAQALGLTRQDPTFSAAEFWQRAKEMQTTGRSIVQAVAFTHLVEVHIEDMQMRISHEQQRNRELVTRCQQAESQRDEALVHLGQANRELATLKEHYKLLAEEMTQAIQKRKEAEAAVSMAHASVEGVWLWQGDGNDKPESLACPVVMSADTLRELVAKSNPETLKKLQQQVESWQQDFSKMERKHEEQLREASELISTLQHAVRLKDMDLANEKEQHQKASQQLHQLGAQHEMLRYISEGLAAFAKLHENLRKQARTVAMYARGGFAQYAHRPNSTLALSLTTAEARAFLEAFEQVEHFKVPEAMEDFAQSYWHTCTMVQELDEERRSTQALQRLRTKLEVYLLPQLHVALTQAPEPVNEHEEPMLTVSLGVQAVREIVEVGTSPMPTTPLLQALAPFLRVADGIPTQTEGDAIFQMKTEEFRRLQQVFR